MTSFTRLLTTAAPLLAALALAACGADSKNPQGPALDTTGKVPPPKPAGMGNNTGTDAGSGTSTGTGGATTTPPAGTGGATTTPPAGTGGATTTPPAGTGGATTTPPAGTGGAAGPTGTGGMGGGNTYPVGACKVVMFAMCNKEGMCNNTGLTGIEACEARRRMAYKCDQVTELNPEIDECKAAVSQSPCPFAEPPVCKRAFKYAGN